MRQPLVLSIVQLQAMLAGHSTQIAFQRTVQYHLCILEWIVVDEPVHFGSHCDSGVEAVINTWCVDADCLAVCIAQLYTGCIDVEFAGYQLSHLFSFLPARKQGRAYQNAYQNQV